MMSLAWWLVLIAGNAFATPATSTHPNVLFLLADDQRFDTIHALGNREIQTPNLDRLVRQGTAFTHAFIMGGGQPAVCSPSRAMLMTGRSLFRATTTYAGGTIPPAAPLLPEMFRQAGYSTHIVGKWHNDRAALQRGFTGGSRIFLGGMADHTKIALQDFDATGVYAKTNERVTAGFSSEIFADAAIDFLKGRATNQPYFLYSAFTAPHDPRTPPKEFLDRYPASKIRLPANFLARHPFDNGELEIRDEKLLPRPREPDAVRSEIAAYYAMITHLDAQIGRILDALEATGTARNTIIVFAGDNGLALGQHGLLGKQNLYEHSVRVPLVISGPGVPAGKRKDALCYLLDLFPTLGELANLPVPDGLDGRSLVPVIRGKSTQVREHIFAAYREVQRMVRDDRWKLIHYPKIDRWQLFDLRNDPWERRDLSGEARQSSRIASLRGLLAEWEKSRGNPLAPL